MIRSYEFSFVWDEDSYDFFTCTASSAKEAWKEAEAHVGEGNIASRTLRLDRVREIAAQPIELAAE